MDFTKISIKRPVTVFVVMMIVLILGVVSISKMQMALTPDVDFPVALIMTEYSGAGPEEIENLVTEIIEGAVANVENIDTISSTSSEGVSIVIARFNYGVDLDNAINAIRDKLGMVDRMLPDGASSPTILKMDMNSRPVAEIVISSDSMDKEALKAFAEDTIQPRIERQPGVASVDVTGGYEKEIRIEIDPERLEGLGLTIANIGQILAAENTNQSGGTIEYGENSLTVSSKLKMESIEDVKATPIKLSSGTVLRLQDIARITETNKKIESISRYNGEESINLSVTKASDGNTVTTVNAVKKEVEKISKAYSNIHIDIVNESGSDIENSINNVISNIIIGAILSIATLFIFLKNVGLTGIIAVSMPLSIIGTFVLLYFSGTTLNMISLGGLSIGVGMLVDNSVVVLENIYRYRTAEGFNKITGTYRGTKEVALAVAASTLTTIAVFIPFIFTSGLVLEMMMDLALAVVFSLVMSLGVAVTVVPMLSANYVNNIHRNRAPKPLNFINKLLDLFDRFIKKLDHLYQKSLRWALSHKKKTLLAIVGIFVASLFLMPFIGMELMPASDEGTFTVTVEAPKGSKLEAVNELSLKAEEILEKIPEMKTMTVSISGASGGMGALMGGGSEKSSISVKLVDKTERSKSVEQIMEEIRNLTKGIAGAKITVSASSNMGSMAGGGVTVEIKGEDLDTMKEISDEIERQMTDIEGVRQITSSLKEQDQQVALKIDKDKIRQYGLTGSQVASQVKQIISGYTATTLKVDGSEMDIKIVYPEKFVTTLTNLGDITISTGTGTYIPLSSVAEIMMDEVPSSISRSDQTRYVTVTCDVFGRPSGTVGNEIQNRINQMTFPDGYSVGLGGTNEMMNETFSSLFLVIILAVILVYLVMAAQFESLINPFIIMFTIPLAFTGAILLLFITGQSLSMMALIGCLVLVGIVVNNGIVLVDYINTLRERDGYGLEEAALKACPTRLRPILMTAMTTILGQFPIILSNGSNSEMLKSMGLVIAGGLTASTFLTLFFVPLLYIYFDKIANKIRKILRLKPKMNRLEVEQGLN
ncbi:efflux RND transporter permease subunit [Geosporobacter ferrireducens]|uniref:RND transporter n=1 Tax=Geosporobacter ferrireducens TaxID=1424294 RepID=A0A1D8GNK5_9FIRM|nr:efflux RND transporter permease subunit [Geosporobacter ferrireducens]AOT72509.1 RND transporter [Geosporobacter ferrireducens]